MPDAAAIPLTSCYRCRQLTPTALTHSYTRSFRRKPVQRCINCRLDADLHTDAFLILAFLLPLIALPIAAPFLAAPLTVLLSALVGVSLFCLTLVPLHESAHALAGLVLGQRVAYIVIGKGYPLLTLPIGKARIFILGWGGSGSCYCHSI